MLATAAQACHAAADQGAWCAYGDCLRGSVSAMSTERVRAVQAVLEPLSQAVDMEAWGLFVEAAEEYQKTVRKLNVAVVPENCSFSADEKEFLKRVIQGLQLKAASLQDLSSVQEPSAGSQVDVRRLKTALQDLLDNGGATSVLESSLAATLPQPPRSGQQPDHIRSLVLSDDDYPSTAAGKDLAGSLVQRPRLLPGHTYINITIDKIGLKDPHTYIDPLITISVKNLLGEDLEPLQDTPVASTREISYIVFGQAVEIQRPVEELPQGAAIFFEFKHFKPKKSVISTRCFSFMEMDELKPGKAILEIYKKPTDFLRKKLSLLSIKPLYLHLTLSLHTP